MLEIYRDEVVKTELEQVGYSSGSSKSSKYSKELDSVSFYNYKKNGYSDWCAILNDYCVYVNTDPQTANNARAIVYEPNRDNCGAGCKWKIDYYKKNNAWFPHKSKGCPAEIGDEVFFWAKKYISSENPYGVYHTGRIVGWDSNYLYTVEGNTNGKGDVSKRKYSYSDEKLLGYGRPNWTANSRPQPDPKPTPEPTPEPTPTPDPTPVAKTYMVRVNTKLNVRSGAGTNYSIVKQLSNGDKVTVFEVDGNWGKIADKQWVCMDYLVAIPNGTTYRVCVNTVLNVRSGAGTNYPIIRQLSNGTKVTVFETKGNWGQIGAGEWVCMQYLK